MIALAQHIAFVHDELFGGLFGHVNLEHLLHRELLPSFLVLSEDDLEEHAVSLRKGGEVGTEGATGGEGRAHITKGALAERLEPLVVVRTRLLSFRGHIANKGRERSDHGLHHALHGVTWRATWSSWSR